MIKKKAKPKTHKKRPNRWREVFEAVKYTNGPGDNIYVYG